MDEYRIGHRVTDGARRGTVVGRNEHTQRVQVVWDDGRGESVAAASVQRIGAA